MIGTLLRSVSVRRLAEAPLRSALVAGGIALGVAACIATWSANRSIFAAYASLVRDVTGEVDLVVTSNGGLSYEVIEELSALPEIEHAAGTVEAITQSPKLEGPVLVLGLDVLGDRHFMRLRADAGDDVLEDNALSFVNDPKAALIPKALAEKSGLKIGDEIPLLTPEGRQNFRVHGILRDDGEATIFGAQLVILYLDAAQLAFGRGDRVDRIDLALAAGTDKEEIQRRLKTILHGRGRVETPQNRAAHLQRMLLPMERGLRMGGMVALLVGAILVSSAVSVAVARRRLEIARLRALGATKRAVVAMFCGEALLLSAVGGALGLGMGGLLARGVLAQSAPTLSRFYAPVRPPPPSFDLDLVLGAFLIGLAAAIAGAIFPARRAAAIDSVEVIRGSAGRKHSEIPVQTMALVSGGLLIAGLAVAQLQTAEAATVSLLMMASGGLTLVPALVLALRRIFVRPAERLLGVPGRIAIDNVERNLGRASAIVGGLTLAVSSSVCVGGWGHSLERAMFTWLDESLPADIYLSAGSPVADQHSVPFKIDIADRAKNTPGVRSIYVGRQIDADLGLERIRLLALDVAAYERELAHKGLRQHVLSGPDPVPVLKLQTQPSLVLAENLARKLNVGAGDTLILETTTGPHPVEAVAIVLDYSSDRGFAYIDRRWYLEFWQDELIDTVSIFLEKDAKVEQVQADLRAKLAGDGLFVVSTDELRREIGAVIAQFLAAFRSTDLIALIVAFLGVVGAMLAFAVDRTREIGMLRAIGATRRQILTSFGTEAAFLGFSAAVCGSLIGVPMGWVFVRVLGAASTGWRVPFVFPGAEALRVMLMVTAAAAIAGLWAGRGAMRIDPIEAIRYE